MVKCIAHSFILSVLLTSCISLNERVLGDSLLDNSKAYYLTYNIYTSEELPSELTHSIESAINTKMKALGYQESSEIPDLNIFYKVYTDDFNPMVPFIENLDDSIFSRNDKMKRLELKRGSIYIVFFNKVEQKIVWRGFSDGSSINPRIVKAKTSAIMDHFKIFAVPQKLISASY